MHLGILDMAGFEKTEYYFRRSLWTDKPFVYIATSIRGQNDFLHTWNYVTGMPVDIRVYTNTSAAKLFLNGKELADCSKNEQGYIAFSIPYENGTLSAVCSDTVMDEIATTQAACRMRTELHNGKKMQIIELHMTDDFGSEVVTDNSMVTVTVEGAGKLAGMENGDIADVTEYQCDYRRAFHGRLVAYIRTVGSGDVCVHFHSAGKPDAVVKYMNK